jgi:DNA gyrase subunit A
VVRSPINADFRAMGRSTMGVKFVTPKEGDSVAVVARSVEKAVEEAVAEAADTADGDTAEDTAGTEDSAGQGADATIEDGSTGTEEE